MVAVPLTSTEPPFRLSLSGVVRAETLHAKLRPLHTDAPPRRVVLACEADVRVRPRAIGLLYQTLLRPLTDGIDLLVVSGAPTPLERTLRGLVEKVDTPATVYFADPMADVEALLRQHSLRTLLIGAVPLEPQHPPELSDLATGRLLPAPVRDAAA